MRARRPTTMKGILMGCSTVDIQGLPLTLVISDESGSDPLLSDSLLSAGRLMEAGFEVIFRLPHNASTNGFQPHKYPMYGGTIVTPERPSRTIVIEYSDHTWRYPYLAHQCNWCQSNLGRKTYHCQKARQPGGDLEISTIVDPQNPKTMLTETLAKIHQVTMVPDHPAWFKACGQSKVTKTVSFGPLIAHSAQDMTKLKAFSQTLLPDPVTDPDYCNTHHSPAGTDLRIDWADACLSGRHGER
jgi:hypothetical protein